MSKKIIIYIFLIKLFLFSPLAFSQDVLDQHVSTTQFLSQKMDFNSAITYSLENNNEIRAMRKNLSATERDIGIARSTMMPKLNFSEVFTATNNPTDALALKLNQARLVAADLSLASLNYPGCVTNFLTSGVLEQRILDRKAMMQIKIAKKAYSANGYMFLRQQENLVNQVAQAYLKVISNQEFVETAKLALEDVDRHLIVAEERYKKGEEPYSDITRGRSAHGSREANLISAQKNFEISKMKLGLLLGLENPIEVYKESFPKFEIKDFSIYKDLSASRNDVIGTEILVANAKNNVKANQAEWYPTLSALGAYNFYQRNFPFGGEGNNFTAAAFFRWEIFDGNKRKYDILKAKDKEAEAKEYLLGLKKKVAFEVYETYANVIEHLKNLELTINAEKKAEEDLKSVEKQWENSEVTLVTLIDAQVNLNNLRDSVVQTKFELNEDWITLGYVSGMIYQLLGLK